MRKRTVVTGLLFYFFISTNARNVRDSSQNNNNNNNNNNKPSSSQSMGNFIADMVRTFALSGESTDGKGKVAGNKNQNALSAVLAKMINGIMKNDEKNGMDIKVWPGPCKVTIVDPLWGSNNMTCYEACGFGFSMFFPAGPDCQNAFGQLICPAFKNENRTLTDAIKMLLLHSPLGHILDSWAKIPERILLGNLQWLGAYEECTMEPEAKYCSSELKLNNYGADASLMYGSCWPRNCSTGDVTKLLDLIIEKGFNFAEKKMGKKDLPRPIHHRTLCDNKVDYYTLGYRAALALLIITVLLAIIGTTIESIQQMFGSDAGDDTASEQSTGEEQGKGSSEFKLECGINNTTFITQSSTAELTKSQSRSHLEAAGVEGVVVEDADATFRSPTTCTGVNTSCNHLLDFFICFSVLRNSRLIFSTIVPERTVRSINGLRVISFTWIILGNFYIYGIGHFKTDNIFSLVKDAVHDFSFLAVGNAYVSVDTFYMLGGFLTAYLSFKKFSNKSMDVASVLYSYLHRYLRLTPSLGFIMMLYNFLPQIMRGPVSLAVTQTDDFTDGCHNYWWATLFYFNNFYPTVQKGCLGTWTWYLSNDMQFFIIAPLIVYIMLCIHRTCTSKTFQVLYNFLFLMSLCLISFLVTALITLQYNLPAVPTFGLLIDTNMKNPYNADSVDKVANLIYSKPYCRITPYLVGMFLGYLICYDVRPRLKGMGALITTTGWVSAIIGALTVVYGPWRVFAKNGEFFNDMEVGLYSGCHRFVWGCAVAWVVYACHYKKGGIINTILSWPIWIPLSRLTYSAFLVHLEVIYIFVSLNERAAHYQITNVVFNVISVTVLTYAGGYLLTVLVEYPIMNVEKYIRRVVFRRR